MEIVELTAFEEEYVKGIDGLMRELCATAEATEERVRMVIESPNMHQYAAFDEDDRMVGCATLCVCTTPEKVFGFVEAVVVAAECRGQHLGRQIMERLIADARRYCVQEVHLTSRPQRMAANGLYHALGFEKRDTNVYQLKIE